MQDMLRISGITEAVVGYRSSRGSPDRFALGRWQSFPESVQSILTPYLTSKYRLNNPDDLPDMIRFPRSGPTPDHSTWLRTLVVNFLHKPNKEIKQELFVTISRVIMWHDLNIASFMIPYVVQNVVIDGSDTDVEEIKSEMQAIIEYDIDSLNEAEVSNVKQCSEVRLGLLALDSFAHFYRQYSRCWTIFQDGFRRKTATLFNLPQNIPEPYHLAMIK
jgi:serine/threonine-protein kinase ATR